MAEHTQVKPGKEQSLVPAKARDPLQPKACQRAPTLMAGEAAGGQGDVRVWSPSRRRLWTALAVSSLLAIGGLFSIIFWHTFGFLYGEFAAISLLILTVRALRRPCYITTDDAGIGITTPTGACALRWIDICECQFLRGQTTTLSLCASNTYFTTYSPVKAQLTGYSEALQQELLSVVRARAGLVPDPAQTGRLIRPSMLPLLPAPTPPPPEVGIGVVFQRVKDGSLEISEVEDYSPAWEKGISPGDQVLEVNDLPADKMDEEQALAQTFGFEGSMVSLKVRREFWPLPLEFHVRTRGQGSDD